MTSGSRTRGVFVTGTDTGVGKTLVGCAIARGLRQRGVDLGVMKPFETGVGAEGPLDALALKEAAGVSDALAEICPEQFALPAAPNVAARHEWRRVDLERVRHAFEKLSTRHPFLLVEGAGGLLVPTDDEHEMADLACAFELPLLLVTRGSLGTINHTRLTLEAAAQRELTVCGVVISHCTGHLSEADALNLNALRSELGEQLLGEIPPLEPGVEPGPEHLDWDRLIEALQVSSLLGSS